MASEEKKHQKNEQTTDPPGEEPSDEENTAPEAEEEGESNNIAESNIAAESNMAETTIVEQSTFECSGAFTCTSCLASSTPQSLCVWKENACTDASSEDESSECSLENFAMRESNGGRGFAAVGLGAAILALLFARRRRTMASRAVPNEYRHETVPLSDAGDDDWGWEDGAIDDGQEPEIEMARRKEEEDLSMALALSLSQEKSPPPVAKRKPTRTAFPPKATNAPKPNPKKSSNDGDFFATMGIAAKPTFAKPKTPSWTSQKLSSAADELDLEDNWEDDDDLDDLLSDSD